MPEIYHIADREKWNEAYSTGLYFHPSIESEGFIHCSTRDQIEDTANLYFANHGEILVLSIDPSLLKSPLKYEPSSSRGLFPHVFGPINTDAVVATRPFSRAPSGAFEISFL